MKDRIVKNKTLKICFNWEIDRFSITNLDHEKYFIKFEKLNIYSKFYKKKENEYKEKNELKRD